MLAASSHVCYNKNKGGDDMQKFISKNKLSKKKQREINNLSRKIWHCNPVTHVSKDYRKHDRNAEKRLLQKELNGSR